MVDRIPQTFFFEEFENDVQRVFDELCISRKLSSVKSTIVCNNGRYFVSVKGSEASTIDDEQLQQKLEELPQVSSIQRDHHQNIIFHLHRQDAYLNALGNVFCRDGPYGATDRSISVLVAIDEECSKPLDRMRTVALTEHVISLLATNNCRLYYVASKFLGNMHPNAKRLACSSNCSVETGALLETLGSSHWMLDSTNGNLCVDAKLFLEKNGLHSKYGTSINSINISPEDCGCLKKAALLKHMSEEHMTEIPDVIIHLASHGRNRKVCESGILLEILSEHGKHIRQTYIFNQSVHHKSGDLVASQSTDFVDSYREEISASLIHKYGRDISKDDTWKPRISTLANTAVKFDLLKVNHSSPLNISPPGCHDNKKNWGIFVQYNCARLSNLFSNFECKVQEGYYRPLVGLSEVDFSLLNLEEEWELFGYILRFPKLVRGIVDSLLFADSVNSKYKLSKICQTLWDLCVQLSLYYSRTRILAGNLTHQQNTMQARLWLLKGIHRLMLGSLTMVNVEGLNQM